MDVKDLVARMGHFLKGGYHMKIIKRISCKYDFKEKAVTGNQREGMTCLEESLF